MGQIARRIGELERKLGVGERRLSQVFLLPKGKPLPDGVDEDDPDVTIIWLVGVKPRLGADGGVLPICID